LIDDQAGRRGAALHRRPPFGALLTFGAHKGYGMALMAELLGGALASGMTQRDHDSSKRRVLNGMFSVLVDPAALGDRAAFEHEALAFIDWVKASPPREGVEAVLVAGEPERAWRATPGRGVPWMPPPAGNPRRGGWARHCAGKRARGAGRTLTDWPGPSSFNRTSAQPLAARMRTSEGEWLCCRSRSCIGRVPRAWAA
jgi:hypothetical protein